MEQNREINEQELENVVGGSYGPGGRGPSAPNPGPVAPVSSSSAPYAAPNSSPDGFRWATVGNVTNYLALRSQASYSDSNEIAKLMKGTQFEVKPGKTQGSYVWARYNGIEGWVNSQYVIYG